MNEPKPLDDETFLQNVREARDNGYEVVCSLCGAGVFDTSDLHDRQCPEYSEP